MAAAVRWGRSEALEPTSVAKVRWGRSEVSGAAAASPTVRWGRSEASGAAAAILNPLTPLVDVEPLSTVTLTATLATGSATPDSYVWRRVSGAAVALSGTGATITFPAPAAMDGATVVIGVSGLIGGAQGPERTVQITTLPQIRWEPTTAGWVPVAPALAL